jgi:hypothetical protein
VGFKPLTVKQDRKQNVTTFKNIFRVTGKYGLKEINTHNEPKLLKISKSFYSCCRVLGRSQ